MFVSHTCCAMVLTIGLSPYTMNTANTGTLRHHHSSHMHTYSHKHTGSSLAHHLLTCIHTTQAHTAHTVHTPLSHAYILTQAHRHANTTHTLHTHTLQTHSLTHTHNLLPHSCIHTHTLHTQYTDRSWNVQVPERFRQRTWDTQVGIIHRLTML